MCLAGFRDGMKLVFNPIGKISFSLNVWWDSQASRARPQPLCLGFKTSVSSLGCGRDEWKRNQWESHFCRPCTEESGTAGRVKAEI